MYALSLHQKHSVGQRETRSQVDNQHTGLRSTAGNLGKEEYKSETDTTIEEMTKLIEQSFEYVTDTKIGETTYKLFRKKEAWRLE